jgi:GDP-4-dehydro-6-deoxy-D-mannose reductase
MGSSTLQSLADFAPDVIYHLAAISVPRDCGTREPTDAAWAINVHGTHSVLEAAARLPKRPRVIVASSSHVYGPGNPAQPKVSEEAPLAPVSAYGKTKFAAEQETRLALTHDDVDAVIARTFNHAGPRQDPRLMLSEWCRQMIARSDQPVRVLNLDTYLDLSDVRDVVRAYRLLAAHGERGGVYNLGSGQSHRSGDLFERLRAMAGCDRPFVELTPGLRQQPIADTTRLERLTGWRPMIPLEQTLADELAYWRARA